MTTKKGADDLVLLNYGYNTVNDRTSRTETAGAPAQTDAYAYDGIDQVSQVQYNYQAGPGTQDRLVSYDYDAAGNRETVVDNGAPVSYAANILNQYTAAGTLTPTYDNNGNLTGQGDWAYTYDAQNRMTSASNSAVNLSIAYDARNRPVKRVTSPGLLPLNAVSRKPHGTAGTFDVPLSLTGPPAIEDRPGGPDVQHQLLLTFAHPVSFAGATVTSGTGTVASTSLNLDHTQITLNLSGVANAQTLVVTLASVTDGNLTNDVVIGVSFLLADFNASGRVDGADVFVVRSKAGQTIDSTNFRADLNLDGYINVDDANIARSKSVSALPSSPAISQSPATTYLIYDDWNLISEFDAVGNQVAEYIHGVNVDEMIERNAATGATYYHQDALGSTVALTDLNGSVVERYSYDIYGAPRSKARRPDERQLSLRKSVSFHRAGIHLSSRPL